MLCSSGLLFCQKFYFCFRFEGLVNKSYCQRAVIKCCKGVENRESSCSVDGNANGCSCYGKKARRFLKKLKIELPYGLQDFPDGSAVKNYRVRHDWAHTHRTIQQSYWDQKTRVQPSWKMTREQPWAKQVLQAKTGPGGQSPRAGNKKALRNKRLTLFH